MAEHDSEAFNEKLEERSLMGQWQDLKSEHERKSIVPHVWKWDEAYDSLVESLEEVRLAEEPQGARRALGLQNPVFDERNWSTRTITAALQIVEPGEVAKAHRHNMTAFRFIIEGSSDLYTIVEGEEFPMENGDLVLTPANTWHDHINRSDDLTVWLDGLDAPLWKGLNQIELESFREERQTPDKSRGYHERKYGTVRPTAMGPEEPKGGSPPYRYRWEEAYESLRAAADDETAHSPYDGTVLEYVNPHTDEAPALPSISLRLQLLEAGEETAAHEHVAAEIYHVVEGSGKTVVGDETLEWDEKDSFVVPPRTQHRHLNTGDDESVLFAMSDRPVFEAFSIYDETARAEAESAATGEEPAVEEATGD